MQWRELFLKQIHKETFHEERNVFMFLVKQGVPATKNRVWVGFFGGGGEGRRRWQGLIMLVLSCQESCT